MELVGRTNEISEFEDAINSTKSEMIAVIGRRRVGKTFLIRKYFAASIIFEYVGIFNGTLQEHMNRFTKAQKTYFKASKKDSEASNWFEFFDILEERIAAIKTKKKKVIFLDELPWMGGSNSSFIKALSHFWNAWASKREDIVLVVSGSATAWMHKKIFNSKGGLYNRTTRIIDLQPFTLQETEAFLKTKKINISRSVITDIYMCMGGIPFYLDLIKKGESAAQLINRLFFEKNAVLKNEFDELFNSLFDDLDIYKKCVAVLAKHPYGLTRNELLLKLKKASGSNFSTILNNLEQSKFITATPQFNNKNRERKLKLTDNYCLFYLKFVQQNQYNNWQNIYLSNAWKVWSGLAFENLCMQHILPIKKTLKLDGIQTNVLSWHSKGNTIMHGAQIDLLIDRADKIITVCEIKYYNQQVIINKDVETKMRNKLTAFKHFTKTNKTLFFTLISPYGAYKNNLAGNLIQNEIVLDDLFFE